MGAKAIDHTGRRFGKLVAQEISGRGRQGIIWRCACDCGGSHNVPAQVLIAGRTKSCGCMPRGFRISNDGGLQNTRRPRRLKLHNDPLMSAVGESSGNRGGGGKPRLDVFGEIRLAELRRLARVARETTEEYARMLSQGYVRTAADAFAPESERWTKEECNGSEG